MNVRITVAMDNTVPIGAGSPFLAEHGLSMLVEYGGERLLLDTGQTAAIIHNLGLLGVAPNTLEAIVLSHGHYDHTGGLLPILQHARKTIPVYAHVDAFQEHFSLSDGKRRYIGIPYAKELLTAAGADWQAVGAPLELRPGLWVSGAVPRATYFESGDGHLVVADRRAGCDRQDDVQDDMALFAVGSKGLVVISGCTHSGLVNMVEYGMQLTGCTRLQGWIGGTHLGPVGNEQQERTIARLQAWSPDFIAANHCTGFKMMARLQQTFGERFIAAGVGTVIEFE